jgi:hypothetical protein
MEEGGQKHDFNPKIEIWKNGLIFQDYISGI